VGHPTCKNGERLLRQYILHCHEEIVIHDLILGGL
jgi:hypothetical protein